MIRAETATIQLEANPRRIASLVETGLGLSGYADDTIEVNDLQLPDKEQLDWHKAIIAEFNEVEQWNLDNLQHTAPLIYDQLASDAELEEESVEEYLAGTSLQDYLSELISWCQKELRKQEKSAKQYPVVVAVADTAKDKLCIPWGRLDLMNKYQTALDNQLYKAMKALRDAQEWRNSFIAADAVSVNAEPAEAA